MTVPVQLSDALARRVQDLVSAGLYASFESAVEDLVRLGLATRDRTPRPLPPMPPPVRDPGDDRPIEVDPGRDVNWAP